MLPNFLLIGAMKAGTTAVYSLMGQHPDIYACTPKEPMFFSDDAWNRGWEWYESLFAGHRGERIVAEGSTSYTNATNHEVVAERILQHLPKVRLAYVVRCPVARMVSHHKHRVLNGRRKSFASVMQQTNLYVDISSYFSRLRPYLERFPLERILVLSFEEFVQRPDQLMRQLFEFLDVDPSFELDMGKFRRNDSATRLHSAQQRLGEDLSPSFNPSGGLTTARRQQILELLERERVLLQTHLGRQFDWDLAAALDKCFLQRGPG